MIQTYGAYQIEVTFFDIIKKDGLSLSNKKLYCICKMEQVHWAIPLSEEVRRLREIVEKRVAERKKAQTTVFTTAFGRPYALVLNDAFPIHPVFLKDPLRNTLGEILTLPDDEAALTLKWLRRHIIQDQKNFMKFANDVEKLHQICVNTDNCATILADILKKNPERMDILNADNKAHRLVVAELKRDINQALYASYLSVEQQKVFDFEPSPVVDGKKKHIQWTDRVLADLLKRRSERQTMTEIANDYNVNIAVISNHLKQQKQKKSEMNEVKKQTRKPVQKSRFTEDDRKSMREMYWERISLEKIGQHFGCSGETIRKELKKNGITSALRRKMDFDDVRFFLKRGFSVAEIAEKTNLSIPYLNEIIRNHGLKSDED